MFKRFSSSKQEKALKGSSNTKKYDISRSKRRQSNVFKQKRSAENKRAYIRAQESKDSFRPQLLTRAAT